jgi:hypothetical protein
VFTGYIHEARIRFRKMLRDVRPEYLYRSETVDIEGSITAARSVKEVESILRRAEEIYSRPDRLKVRREPVDDLAPKEKIDKYF